MVQRKLHSFAEAVINLFIGAIVTLAVQLTVFPLYGIELSLLVNIEIMLILRLAALIRYYIIRRLFNHLTHRELMK